MHDLTKKMHRGKRKRTHGSGAERIRSRSCSRIPEEGEGKLISGVGAPFRKGGRMKEWQEECVDVPHVRYFQ